MPIPVAALRGIFWSVLAYTDKIPDKWFDKIPYYQSEEMRREEKERKRAKKYGYEYEPSRGRGKSEDRKRDRHSGRDGRRRRSHEDGDSRRRRERRHEDDFDESYAGPRRSSTVNYGASRDHDYDQDRRHAYDSRRTSRAGMANNSRGEFNQDFETNQGHEGHSPVATDGGPPRRYSVQTDPRYGHDVRASPGGYAENERVPSSGPINAYVPYANIYNSPTQSVQSPSTHSPRTYTTTLNDRRGSQAHSHTPHGRRDSRAQDKPYRSDDGYSDDSYDYEDHRQSRTAHQSSGKSIHGPQTGRLYKHDERVGTEDIGLE